MEQFVTDSRRNGYLLVHLIDESELTDSRKMEKRAGI
jgi:hypothetical protein